MTDRRIEMLSIYERVTRIVWQRLSPTFGLRTINAIAKNVIVRQARGHPFVGYLTVREEGLDWSDAKRHVGAVSEPELTASLEALLDEFFDALSGLIGRLIAGKLFHEAEELAKKGKTQ
ncbi:MAG: hypothetical protein ACM3US_12220 [Sphingomonadaceae bacterium]